MGPPEFLSQQNLGDHVALLYRFDLTPDLWPIRNIPANLKLKFSILRLYTAAPRTLLLKVSPSHYHRNLQLPYLSVQS